jgi:hypothetical protein
MKNKTLSYKAAIFHAQNVPAKIKFVFEWTDRACQMISPQIKQTNKTTEYFRFAAVGQNGKLYFGSSSSDGAGIWYLDDDGQIKQTNKTTGSFSCAALGQDGKLYFGSNYSAGIWYLDNDGQIKQTNKTIGSFSCAALGQDGKLYFGSSNYEFGIWYLDNDGQIKRNQPNGNFFCAALGQDGKLYFGSSGNDIHIGIWYLDNDGQIKRTNQTDGGFSCAALGQDGKLYFGCDTIYGVGIWYLDNDGQIKQSNKTGGSFNSAALGQDGKLYFCGYNNGIWYLDNDGQIKQTNKTTGSFNSAALVLDGKLYFCSNDGAGIWYLEMEDNTGNALAKTLALIKLRQGNEISRQTYNILSAFGGYIAILESEYINMSDNNVEKRANALVGYVAFQENVRKYTTNNEVIVYDTDICPLPVRYRFSFANGTLSTAHTIGYHETFIDTITSIKNGVSTEYTVQSKPTWATVSINGNVATVTSSNSGTYREGSIVYRQTETGDTITSAIKQYGVFAMTGFLLGIGKYANTSNENYPGAPEDYGISFDFEIKIDNVLYVTGSGSRNLDTGDTESLNQSPIFINGYDYAKTVEIFINNLQVNYPGKTATIAFGGSGTYSVLRGYITEIEVDSDSAYIKIEDKGGMPQLGEFRIYPIVKLIIN